MGDAWTVNDDRKLTAYIEHVKKQFCDHKYLTFPAARIGADRSTDQNSLLYVWIRELCCHYLRCHDSELTKGHVEGIKKTLKGKFYSTYNFEWMIHEVNCPITKRSKIDYTSSADWGHGEMFIFLDWMQNAAAEEGVILESKGKFAKLKREQHGL